MICILGVQQNNAAKINCNTKHDTGCTKTTLGDRNLIFSLTDFIFF